MTTTTTHYGAGDSVVHAYDGRRLVAWRRSDGKVWYERLPKKEGRLISFLPAAGDRQSELEAGYQAYQGARRSMEDDSIHRRVGFFRGVQEMAASIGRG